MPNPDKGGTFYRDKDGNITAEKPVKQPVKAEKPKPKATVIKEEE